MEQVSVSPHAKLLQMSDGGVILSSRLLKKKSYTGGNCCCINAMPWSSLVTRPLDHLDFMRFKFYLNNILADPFSAWKDQWGSEWSLQSHPAPALRPPLQTQRNSALHFRGQTGNVLKFLMSVDIEFNSHSGFYRLLFSLNRIMWQLWRIFNSLWIWRKTSPLPCYTEV